MEQTITPEMHEIRRLIVETVAKRNALKVQMEEWYKEHPNARFEYSNDLIATDATLSELDSHYKRLWDYYNSGSRAS
jgi:uncharacterized protein